MKAYYVLDPLLGAGDTVMNRTEFLSLRPSQGKTDKYTGNWSDELWLIKISTRTIEAQSRSI